MRMVSWAALCLAIGLSSGCGSPLRGPDLGGIYNRAAQQSDLERNPIIVIPGVLGSRLEHADSGRTVWGAFGGFYASPRTDEGSRLIALPMEPGLGLSELRDDVMPVEVLDRVRVLLLRLPVEQNAYLSLLAALGAGGYRDENLGLAGAIDYGEDHYTCFQFAYDWRRDNAENARRLHEFLMEKREQVLREDERRFGKPRENLRFDIVAHSMGGLLLRYYLRYGPAELGDEGPLPALDWAGAPNVERAVLVATPNAGSIESLTNLLDGAAFSWVLPSFPAGLLGTMPALYQLLPRERHRAVVAADGETALDLLDPAVWERNDWGLLDPGQDSVLERLLPESGSAEERRRVAADHLEKALRRARRFQEALDRPAAPPAGLTLHLIAGDAEPTSSRARVDPDGRLEITEQAPGDGTVLRSSAILDERIGSEWRRGLRSPIAWERVTFLFQDHLGLTRDPAFTDNLLYVLLEEPREPWHPEASSPEPAKASSPEPARASSPEPAEASSPDPAKPSSTEPAAP